jgi:hypothetical protein
MTLKSLIEEIIKDNDYTVSRIAKETGIAKGALMRIKSGKTIEPRYNTALKLLTLYFTLQYKGDKPTPSQRKNPSQTDFLRR